MNEMCVCYCLISDINTMCIVPQMRMCAKKFLQTVDNRTNFDNDGDIDAIGVCEMSRNKRSFTRSFACLKNSTASS